MRISHLSPALLVTGIFLNVNHLSANPIGPGNMAIVSEVQVLAPDQWSVEIDPQMFAGYFSSGTITIAPQSQNPLYGGAGTEGMLVH